MVALIATLTLIGCGDSGCPTTSLGSGGGGTTGGGVNTGGSVCGSGVNNGGGSAAGFVFYIDTAVETAALTTSGGFSAVATNPDGFPSGATGTHDMETVESKFLYIPWTGTNNVAQAFTINSGGSLTSISGSPFLLNPTATADGAVPDPQGRFLYVGGLFTGSISAFQIDQTTGALTESPGSPFINGQNFSADSMAIDGSGKYLYVAQSTSTAPVWVYAIDQNNGALTAVGAFDLGVAQIHCDSSGKYLLGVAETANQFGLATEQDIHVFSIDSSGLPSEVAGSPFATVAAPFDFAISPNGRFVYTQGNVAGGGATAPIEGFQIDPSTGTLTALPNSPFANLPSDLIQCRFNSGGGVMFCGNDTFSGFTAVLTNPSTGGLTNNVPDLLAISFPFASN